MELNIASDSFAVLRNDLFLGVESVYFYLPYGVLVSFMFHLIVGMHTIMRPGLFNCLHEYGVSVGVEMHSM